MTVRIFPFGAGANRPPQLAFTDPFTRADNNSLGEDWIRIMANSPAGVSLAGAEAIISTNQMLVRGTGGLNPAAFVEPFFTPVVVYNNLYNLSQTFARATYTSQTAGLSFGITTRFNTEFRNGAGVRSYDCYVLIMTDGDAGNILRLTGVATTSLGNAGWVNLAANDVVELRVSGQGATVTLNAIRNGATDLTVTDAAATRNLIGVPGVLLRTMSGDTALRNFRLTQFACGVWT